MDVKEIEKMTIQHSLNFLNFSIDEMVLLSNKLKRILEESSEEIIVTYCSIQLTIVESQLIIFEGNKRKLERQLKRIEE